MSLTKASYSMVTGAPANVLDYGADPTGVSDSAAAIQAAFDASATVYIPDGNYRLESTVYTRTIRQTITFGSQAYLQIAHNGTSGIEVEKEWLTLVEPKIVNASGFNSSSNNGVNRFIYVKSYYFCVRGGFLQGKYTPYHIYFAPFIASPLQFSGVSILDGVRLDGLEATNNVGLFYAEQSNVQRIHSCYITNFTNGLIIDGGMPSISTLSTAFEGCFFPVTFQPSVRRTGGLLASKFDTCYFENFRYGFTFAHGDVQNVTVNNCYFSGDSNVDSKVVQVSDTAGAGVISNIVFSNNWYQNCVTAYNLGTSLVQRLNWSAKNNTIGTGVSVYSSGYFKEVVLPTYDKTPVYDFLTYSGSYPAGVSVDETYNQVVASNAYAGGQIDYTLPTLGANYNDVGWLGMRITFTRRLNFAMRVYPDANSQIGGSTAGKYYELGSNGASLTIVCTAPRYWSVESSNGTINIQP